MTNFLLVDAPNFVLLVSTPEGAERRSLGEPEHLNPEFADVVRLLDVSLAVDELSRPVTFSGASALVMRRVLARYGFDLPPLTVGELYGLFEYCDRLDALTGIGVFALHQLPRWRRMSHGLRPSSSSPSPRAIEMYARGDTVSLRDLHREQGTLAELGRRYRAVDGTPDR